LSRSARKSVRKPATLPLDVIESELHEAFSDESKPATWRPVTIVDAKERKALSLRIELPPPSPLRGFGETGPRSPLRGFGEASPAPGSPPRSAWASIHPRLLELVRGHRSTLMFVNNRRLAERLAASLNELAGEPLVRSHHGSIARETRSEVEELLKAGGIRGLVATSSLELGIDMGAIDLVVQIEAPPSVASGLQRIGRSGHQAGAESTGVIFPKFRGDLVACAAVARAMHDGLVESTRYPRNPLDVLAQQIVAMAAEDTWVVDDLFAVVRRAAPFADLSRQMFEGVLDMLSGRYPSDEFAELRPRVTWDRVRGTVTGREGAQRVAIANAGTIPDRGLYGVFLAGADRPTRVGELDEEMVFETKVGETFTLGASTWRVEEITHDRVLVTPAPGEPGKMPFWHRDQAGRPVELGYTLGALVRELRGLPPPAAVDRLVRRHDLDAGAADTLLTYLADQAAAGAVPDDRTIVIERCRDELGDWRVCLLSPLGSRIHAPWAMAVTARIRQELGFHVEAMWGDDGFVIRFPDVESPPDPALLLPDADETEGLVLRQLGATSLFAARFREAAARALLLPRRRPGTRTPLWRQRKRASDLLAVAARFGSFPMLLETYREVLRDHFDMPALIDTLRKRADGALQTMTIDSTTPSPFAASLLFSYVANYIYDGDTPLAERRAQALSVDQAQLRELIGDAELRTLLDPDALAASEHYLQHLDLHRRVRTADGLHDLLIQIGDLTIVEVGARSAIADTAAAIESLRHAGRITIVTIAGESRLIAAEDVSRYRDALGIRLAPGLPESLLEPVRDPAGDLVMRFARSHGPFAARDVAARFGLGVAVVEGVLSRLVDEGRLIEGEFRPGGSEREWVEPDVLRGLRRRSLARLRQEVEPVAADALGRFLVSWHGIGSGRQGLEAVLDAIEQLQGAALAASTLERDILPARVADYQPAMLDSLMAAGEIVWIGVEPLGERDGRIALYLTDAFRRLRQPRGGDRDGVPLSERAQAIITYLDQHGASFFTAVRDGTGGGFPRETVDALWELVWRGLVTNDTLHPLRAFARGEESRSITTISTQGAPFRSRRLTPPAAEGRWSLVRSPRPSRTAQTEWAAALAQQLLTRHGIVTRETAMAEDISGGFSSVYQVLKAMDDAGKIRRGYFVAGLGGAQFAQPAALDLLRSHRDTPETPRTVVIAATDPANPYGSSLPWPQIPTGDRDAGRGATRSVGALVVLVDGQAAAYLRRSERELLVFEGEAEPLRSRLLRETARALIRHAARSEPGRRGMLISEINGVRATAHAAARPFVESGFLATAMGLQARITGTGLADTSRGDDAMDTAEKPASPTGPDSTAAPRDRRKSASPLFDEPDQVIEREGLEAEPSRADEKPGRKQRGGDVDPDSAHSAIDRDDTVDE
jgi:ATP-dependent Lhr-like helicase